MLNSSFYPSYGGGGGALGCFQIALGRFWGPFGCHWPHWLVQRVLGGAPGVLPSHFGKVWGRFCRLGSPNISAQRGSMNEPRSTHLVLKVHFWWSHGKLSQVKGDTQTPQPMLCTPGDSEETRKSKFEYSCLNQIAGAETILAVCLRSRQIKPCLN